MKTILIRTSLVFAIVAGTVVIALNVTQLKEKLTSLNNRLASQTTARERAEADLANARQEASKAGSALKRTADALEAKSAEAIAQAEQIAKLNGEAKKLRDERSEAQQKLTAYEFSMTPEQVANAVARIKSLEDSLAASEEEKVLLLRQVKKLSSFLPNVCGICPIEFPADFTAKVLAVDPKWQFVVLSAGEDQGAIPHGELLVSRGGRLVARVCVRSVQKNRCVADVMAGWNLAELLEGDQAIPAYPKS